MWYSHLQMVFTDSEKIHCESFKTVGDVDTILNGRMKRQKEESRDRHIECVNVLNLKKKSKKKKSLLWIKKKNDVVYTCFLAWFQCNILKNNENENWYKLLQNATTNACMNNHEKITNTNYLFNPLQSKQCILQMTVYSYFCHEV